MNSDNTQTASAADAVLNQIFDLILDSGLEVLPSESELCETLSSSRTTVRAALQTLQAKGIIIKQPKKKTAVAARENWDWFDPLVLSKMNRCFSQDETMLHVGALRLSFEPNAAALCALNCQISDLVDLEKGCDLMKQGVNSNDPELFEKGDIIFHRSVFLGTKNPFFIGLQSLIINTSILSISTTLDPKPLTSSTASLDNHLKLFELIRFKQPKEAREAMRRIVTNSLKKLFASKLPQYVDFIK